LPATIAIGRNMDRPRALPAREFFDRRRTLKGTVANVAALGILGPLLYLGIRHSGYLLRHGHSAAVALCWALTLGFFATLPRRVRDQIERHRGRPVVRLDERGLWVRDEESLGWIAWADIAEVVVESSASGSHDLSLMLRHRGKYVARMDWIDWLPTAAQWSLGKLLDVIAGKSGTLEDRPPDDRKIAVISSNSIEVSWAEFIAALDPFLSEHRIPRRESFGGGVAKREWDGPAIAEPTTPSTLVAQFPNGGPELSALLAKLVAVQPTLADQIVGIARTANTAQQDAIGTGLGDASRKFGKLAHLAWAHDAEANIRQAMAGADDRTRAAWLAGTSADEKVPLQL
jgi:hypothetical protein